MHLVNIKQTRVEQKILQSVSCRGKLRGEKKKKKPEGNAFVFVCCLCECVYVGEGLCVCLEGGGGLLSHTFAALPSGSGAGLCSWGICSTFTVYQREFFNHGPVTPPPPV